MVQDNTQETNNKMLALPTLKFEKLHEGVRAPFKPKDSTDAGYDVYAWTIEKMFMHSGGNGESLISADHSPERLEDRFQADGKSFTIQYGERVLISTGLKVTVAEGWELQVRPRSGHAWKKGLTIVNAPGTIDAGYRGELRIIVLNTSRKEQFITLGDAIAQIVPKKVYDLKLEECKLDDTTIRGDDGFGSTDKEPLFVDDEYLVDNFEQQDKIHGQKIQSMNRATVK